MTNILITGSRSITEKSWIFNILRKELVEGDVIIHGGAQGADSIAHEFCKHNNFCTVIMRPIHPYKKDYYLHRNAEMVGMCDRVIAFWDGASRGTLFTTNYARDRNLNVKVFIEDKNEK